MPVGFHYINENNRIFKPQKVFSIRTLPNVNYSRFNDTLLLDINNYIRNNYTVILCAGSDEVATKLSNFLSSNKISNYTYARMGLCNKNTINLYSEKIFIPRFLPMSDT